MFTGHVFLLVQRKAERVVQAKSHRTGNHGARRGLHLVAENAFGDFERRGVAPLFVAHHAAHAFDAVHHLRIARLHQLGHERGQIGKIRVLASGHTRIAQRAAHDFAQHVTAPFIRWQHPIVDEECGGAGVVGIDAKGGIGAVVSAILDTNQFAGAQNDGMNEVGIVIRQLTLHDGGGALQPHACVDGRARQRRHRTIRAALELHENKIPDLDVPPSAIVGETRVFAAWFSGFGAQIVVDL